MTKFPPSLFWCHWNLQYGRRWSINMAAVGNNKSILWSSQNSLVIFIYLELSKGTYWLHSKPISEASKYDLLTNTKLWMVFSRWPPIGFKTIGQNRFITTMSCSIQSYFWDQWEKTKIKPKETAALHVRLMEIWYLMYAYVCNAIDIRNRCPDSKFSSSVITSYQW